MQPTFHLSKGIDKKGIKQHAYPIAMLVVIALVTYGIFYAPILYSDDWSLMIGRWYFGKLKWFDLTELRPLQKARLVILYSLFGLNIHAFYLVLWLLNVLNVVQLYFLLLKFIPKNVPIALSIAAIVLVHPANFTHMWLTMIQIRTVVLLTLLYAHLLLIYAESGRWLALWAALLSLIVSLGMYEGQFGVAMAWCLLVAFLYRSKPWPSLLPLLLPLVMGFAFTVWQAVGTSLLGVVGNQRYMNEVVLTPAVILVRWLTGFQVMVWAWVEPLTLAFGLNALQAVAVILVAMVLCSLTIYEISRRYPHRLVNIRLTYQQHRAHLRVMILMMLGGTIFMAAGYIPTIALVQPTFFPLGSRVNLFPSLGATVALVSFIAVIVILLNRKQPQINLMVLAATIPLIILGSAIQLEVQYDNRADWEAQKHMWSEFFELAPDLKDGTVVYFMFGEFEEAQTLYRIKRAFPLEGSGDISAALNILYGKYDLRGDIVLRAILLKKGIKIYYNNEIVPYDQIIFVRYDDRLNHLSIIEDLAAEGLVDFPIPAYNPYGRIIETPTFRGDLRWLVGVDTIR